ncbi:MAG: hypothetical protein ACOVOV_18375, partial [Dolichospermum sp.]
DKVESFIIDNDDNITIAYVLQSVAGTSIDVDPSPTDSAKISFAVSGSQVVVAKYTNSGDYLWSKAASSTTASNNVRPLGIGIDKCNNVIVGGAYTGSINFNPTGSGGSYTIPSQWGCGVVKYNGSNGNYMWSFMNTALTNSCYRLVYNKNISRYAITGDFGTSTTYPNLDLDPTTGTRNIQSVNTTSNAFVANYPDPGNVIPTITFSSVSDVSTTSINFNLPFSATTGSPDQYSISTITPTAMPSFIAINNATLSGSPISVTIPASAANTYNFVAAVRNSTTGCVSANTNFTVVVIPSSTTWNGTTWSNGVPSSTVDAIIASNTAPASFACKAFTINSTFALNTTGITATVNGNIVNNGNGIAGTGSLIINANSTISGTAISFNGALTVNTGATLTTGGLLTLASNATNTARVANSAGLIDGVVTVQRYIPGKRAWRFLTAPLSSNGL